MSTEETKGAQDTTKAPEVEKVEDQLYGKEEETKEPEVKEDGSKDGVEATKTEESKEEDYELKAKEDSRLEESEIKRIALFAKEQGLKKDQAEKLLDISEEVFKQREAESAKQLEKIKNDWIDQLKNDEVFGGAKFKENLELAQKGAKYLFSEKFIDSLAENGLGNHPELVKGLKKVGSLLADDTFIMGTKRMPSDKPQRIEDRLYPDS